MQASGRSSCPCRTRLQREPAGWQRQRHSPTAPPTQQARRPPCTHAAADNGPKPDADGCEEPLWFIAKFESRRKALEEQQRQQQQQQQTRSDQAPSSSRPDPPSDLSPTAAAPQQPPTPSPPPAAWARAAAQQSLLLALGLAALILWPAALHPGGLSTPRVWLLFLSYLAFFTGGSVRRILRHGPLARASRDVQRATLGARAALLAFIAAMPVLHWLPLRRYLSILAATPLERLATQGVTLYDALGGALIGAGIALNWQAASALGAAYDRVVAPDKLVTAGPYSLVQHPIYGSYMLLFSGYALACHSAPFAILAIWVCAIYYRQRAALESEVLRAAFGAAYDDYRTRTPKLFVPWIA